MKIYKNGTHRIVSPQQTLKNVQPFLPDFGISRLADITGIDYIGIPTVACYRPNSRSVAVSMGKGTNIHAARASAVMESIESWHAESIEHDIIQTSFEKLLSQKRRIIDINLLPTLYGKEFDKTAEIYWIEGYDLYSNETVLAPYELVHTNYTRPRLSGEGIFITSSNGLASGNCLEEALSHAITEVVERDCNTFWELSEDYLQPHNRLILDTVSDGNIEWLLQKYRQSGIQVGVWSMTTDVGIPAFLCWIMENKDRTGVGNRSFIGAGCHPVREIALTRALTEAAQDRLALISGARDDLDPDEFGSPDTEVQAIRESIFYGIKPRYSFEDAPSFSAVTLEEDIEWELDRLRSAGVKEVIVFELTKKRYNISVVKAVIPGLEAPHDEAGYQPGLRIQKFLDS